MWINKNMKSFFLILLTVILMETSGLQAFSEIVGCKVTSGTYDLQEYGVIVRAEGVIHRITLDIIAAWINGVPQIIITNRIKVEI